MGVDPTRHPRISNHNHQPNPTSDLRATPPRGTTIPTPQPHAPATTGDNQPAPAEEPHQPRNLPRGTPPPAASPPPTPNLPGALLKPSIHSGPHPSTPHHHPPAHQPIGNHHIAVLPAEPAQGPSATHRPRVTVNHRRGRTQAAPHPPERTSTPLTPITAPPRAPLKASTEPARARITALHPHDSTHPPPPTTRPLQVSPATTGSSTQAPPTIDVGGHRPPQHHNNHHRRPPPTPEQTPLPPTPVCESDIDTHIAPRPPRAEPRLHDRHQPVPRKIVAPHHITAPQRTPNPPPPRQHRIISHEPDDESRTARLPAMKQRRVGPHRHRLSGNHRNQQGRPMKLPKGRPTGMDSSELIAGDGSARAPTIDHVKGRKASRRRGEHQVRIRHPLTPHHRSTLGQLGSATTRRNHRELQEPSGRNHTTERRNPDQSRAWPSPPLTPDHATDTEHHDRIDPLRPHHRPINPRTFSAKVDGWHVATPSRSARHSRDAS